MGKKQIWVHSNFKKKIKREAIESDMSLLEYTEFLSKKKNRKKLGDGNVQKNPKYRFSI